MGQLCLAGWRYCRPMISGFLYAWSGFANTLLVAVLMVVTSFFLFMKIGDKPIQEVNNQDEIITSIKQGIRFVFKTKIILYSISLDLFSVMFGGVMAILPIYAEDILHVGRRGWAFYGLHLRLAPSLHCFF